MINGAGSVFATPAADDWLRLLEALERPVSTGRARAAALTSFLGWSAEQMATADDSVLEELHTKSASLGRSSPQPRRRRAARLDLRDRGRPRSRPRPSWAANAG